jgi:hypothetical protein
LLTTPDIARISAVVSCLVTREVVVEEFDIMYKV